jgi:conjugative transfer signal peptidase TraF
MKFRITTCGLLLRTSAVLIGAFQVSGWLGIRINTSPSLPLGFYIATSDGTANLIEFCPAEPFADLAISRGYRDRGNCADDGAPLLKPIVAKQGDFVDLSRNGISVNGRLLPNTEPLARDTKGRALEHWVFGRYTVTEGNVWVGSSYNVRSFDSRYFGPIPISTIRERLRPLLTVW